MGARRQLRLSGLLLLALLALGAGGLPGKPPAPTLEGGLLTVRVDPERPEVHLDWNVSALEEAAGIDYEVSRGAFPDRNPRELSDRPLREGHFRGRSGWGLLDLRGLPEGEYFVRYLAVDARGRPVSLASDPARFVIIGRGPALGPAAVPGPVPAPAPARTTPAVPSPPAPGTTPATSPGVGPSLEPASATVPLGGTCQLQAPGPVTSWRVVEGPGAGTVEAGLYRAPSELPGGPRALTGSATVEARLADGRVGTARILLVRPR